MQQADRSAHEPGHPRGGELCPPAGQLLDDRGHLLGFQRADTTGDRIHMIRGDDPGRPRRGQGPVLGGQRPGPGQPAGRRHRPLAGRQHRPRDPPAEGCPPPWRRASGGPTRTPPRRTPRPAPPHPRTDAPRPADPSTAGPRPPPRWPAPTGPPPPATPTPHRTHRPQIGHLAVPTLCCSPTSPDPNLIRTPVRTLSPGSDNAKTPSTHLWTTATWGAALASGPGQRGTCRWCACIRPQRR